MDCSVEADAATRPATLYVHRCADGSLDLEGHGCLSASTVTDLLAAPRCSCGR
jgi:hypothetical protein